MEKVDWTNSIIRKWSVAARWNFQVMEKKETHTHNCRSGKTRWRRCSCRGPGTGTPRGMHCLHLQCQDRWEGHGAQGQQAAAAHWPWARPLWAMAASGQGQRHCPGFPKARHHVVTSWDPTLAVRSLVCECALPSCSQLLYPPFLLPRLIRTYSLSPGLCSHHLHLD